jgi:hypothetical protein
MFRTNKKEEYIHFTGWFFVTAKNYCPTLHVAFLIAVRLVNWPSVGALDRESNSSRRGFVQSGVLSTMLHPIPAPITPFP